MVRELYYEDSMLARFSARVLECKQENGRWQVILDATAFYPEGGGQPCDLGSLGNVRVVDVQRQGEEVIHFCDGPLTVGQTVEGQIDWARRMDLMQQHTGEHMVSGVICRRFGVHNVGFHMSSDVITIDFDGIVPQQALPKIEAEVNTGIWQNLPVRCYIPSPEELNTIPYRSKKSLPWPVRLVEIPGVDSCACCGVHVVSTGQVGLVKLISCVKFHQGVRMELVCGGRAFELLNRVYDQARQVSKTFSVPVMQIGDGATQFQQRLSAAEYRITELERQGFDRIAQVYAGQGDVVHFHSQLNPNGVRELADRIAQHCGGKAAVFAPAQEGFSVCLVHKGGDVSQWGNALKEQLAARGGGKPGYFQGSVNATEEQIRKALTDK